LQAAEPPASTPAATVVEKLPTVSMLPSHPNHRIFCYLHRSLVDL